MKKIQVIKIIKEIGRNAHVDWIVVLFVSVGTTLALALGGWYLYNAVVRGNIQGNDAPATISTPQFNEKAISSVTERFNKREEISVKARSGYSGPGDPSL